MRSVEVETVRALRFADGSPVRAASAVAPFGDGWLVAQDDAAHAAWVRADVISRVRVVPPVEGHDLFAAKDMKHLKPDLEAACAVDVEGEQGVLLLGSGSGPRRQRLAVVLGARDPGAVATEMPGLYARMTALLELADDQLNLEGACLVDGRLRWFARGNLAAGVPSASVDVDPRALVAAVLGGCDAEAELASPTRYDFGAVDGVGLEVSDAVALPGGQVLVSLSAEDSPNAVDDGPVVATALALLDGADVVARAMLPELGGQVHKVEGLTLLECSSTGARLLAVVDDDDDTVPSASLVLRVHWS